MAGEKIVHASVEAYIASFPAAVQENLQALRAIVKAAAPEAEEKIAYQIPAYHYQGSLVYFGAWKKHIGFYPASGEVFQAFQEALAPYQHAKGSLRLPLDAPLPLALITDIVHFRVAENMYKAAAKSKARPKRASDG
jgi:uncharacterized protein YdhG (YjbR/CyaY superfamily)